ncbi:kinase domain-containing protein [Favolaschia claudopus]|uniref:Kinase domain-containing protein n=1 Tax=Favolaschia claudopus TaxID=2862362 RepID=A0AAV9ZST8_9AGAR
MLDHYCSSAALYPAELFWRDNFAHIIGRGYRLRSRYNPDWVPSWQNGRQQRGAEDSIPTRGFCGNVNNAWRCVDDLPVVLKRARHDELAILQHLHGLPRSPDNRTIPLLDFFPVEHDLHSFIIVMPMCGRIDEPPVFTQLGDLLRAFHQLAKGLSFMHQYRIAHRDACVGNFVEDRSRLVPGGQQFKLSRLQPDGRKQIKSLKRSAIQPAYYIIDFELSLIEAHAAQCCGKVGQDKSVPEDSDQNYDPFLRDIYQFGSAIRTYFLEKYEGLEPVLHLVDQMTRTISTERPTAADVAQQLQLLCEEFPVGPRICLRNASYFAKRRIQFMNRAQLYLARIRNNRETREIGTIPVSPRV